MDQANNNAATIIGVVSWGFGCAEANSLGVYAEVSHFRSWLEENMEDLASCPPPLHSTWSVPQMGDSEEGVKPTTTITDMPTSSTPQPSSLSLTGGASEFEGTVLLGGRPICDDLWSVPAARVVCRQLGFSGGEPLRGSYFTSAGTDFVMDNVICSGSEVSITDCQHETEHNCRVWEAAGVRCRHNDQYGNPVSSTGTISMGIQCITPVLRTARSLLNKVLVVLGNINTHLA